MKYIVIFILSHLLFSCSLGDEVEEKDKVLENNKPYTITKLTFHLDFLPRHTLSHVYESKSTKDKYIYFTDLITAKKISIFSLKGQKIKDLSLPPKIHQKYTIEDIHVENKNNIFLLLKSSNILINVDSTFAIRDSIRMPSVDELGRKIVLNSSIYSGIKVDENFVLECRPAIPSVRIKRNNDIVVEEYYDQIRKIPGFVSFELNDSQDSIMNEKYIFPELRKSFGEAGDRIPEMPYHGLSGKKLLNSSIYSDSVHIYDFNTNLRTSIRVKSDCTSIGGAPRKLHENTLSNDARDVNDIYRYSGLINRVFYDSHRNLLYVMVFHEQKDENSKIYGAGRPWSLIVYNEDFEKVYEEAFEHDEYSMGFTKLTPRGLMILKQDKEQHEKNKRSEEKLYTFDIFDFDI